MFSRIGKLVRFGHLCVPLSQSVCLSLSVTVCLSVPSLSLCLSLNLSSLCPPSLSFCHCLSVCPSCLSVSVSISLPVCLSLSLSLVTRMRLTGRYNPRTNSSHFSITVCLSVSVCQLHPTPIPCLSSLTAAAGCDSAEYSQDKPKSLATRRLRAKNQRTAPGFLRTDNHPLSQR